MKKGKKPIRERQYHGVEISKLAKAFEDQFFKHFAMITQLKQDGGTQTYQADSLSVTTSKDRYDLCKKETFEAVKNFQRYCWCWLGVSIVVFVALILDVTMQTPPVLISLS